MIGSLFTIFLVDVSLSLSLTLTGEIKEIETLEESRRVNIPGIDLDLCWIWLFQTSFGPI